MKAAVVSLVAVAALAAPARADECGQFWSFPGGVSSPAGWDALISFASCTQDRRVYLVEDAGELEGLVNALEDALAPSMQLYAAAIEQGPPDVQLRAAYHVGLAQIAMMTRARASLASSDLRTSLEPLLEPHAELAYYVFTTIHRAAADDPALCRDVVTRNMARSSRLLSDALRTRWATPPDDDALRVARPR